MLEREKSFKGLFKISELSSRMGLIWPEDKISSPTEVKNMGPAVDGHGSKPDFAKTKLANLANYLSGSWFPHQDDKKNLLISVVEKTE